MNYAHQTAMQNAAFANEYQATTAQISPNKPPETTVMAALLQKVGMQNQELHALYERLTGLRSRLFGPEPASGGTSPKALICGAISEVGTVLDQSDALLRALHGTAHDLERLA